MEAPTPLRICPAVPLHPWSVINSDQRGMEGSVSDCPLSVNFNERRRTAFSLKIPPVLSKWQDSQVRRWLPLSSLRLEQPEKIKLMHLTHRLYMFCLLRRLHFGADGLGLQQGGTSQLLRHCFLGLWHWSGMVLRPWEHNIKAKTSRWCADLTWERTGGAGVCRVPETLSRPCWELWCTWDTAGWHICWRGGFRGDFLLNALSFPASRG